MRQPKDEREREDAVMRTLLGTPPDPRPAPKKKAGKKKAAKRARK
jgi:hypothetical protein